MVYWVSPIVKIYFIKTFLENCDSFTTTIWKRFRSNRFCHSSEKFRIGTFLGHQLVIYCYLSHQKTIFAIPLV